MKTIGLIGGTSWVSTVDYYKIINTTVNQRLGGNESAKIVLNSVNYGEIVRLTRQDDWTAITAIVSEAARKTEQAGADCLLLCANTMHRIAPEVQVAINIPLLHIAEVTATAVHTKGIKKILLLGTRYTMLGDFYPDKLKQYGIELLVPDEAERDLIHESIYNEMGQGIFLPETKNEYISIIERYSREAAGGVILGCTEIPMLLTQEDSPIPIFDTTQLHAIAAVEFALAEQTQ